VGASPRSVGRRRSLRYAGANAPRYPWPRRALRPAPDEDVRRWLRILRYRELIRVAVADFSGLDDFAATTQKISQVADVCVQRALDATGLDEEPFAVIAMGKWGGLEVNYSSDIDALFVASDDVDQEALHRLPLDGKEPLVRLRVRVEPPGVGRRVLAQDVALRERERLPRIFGVLDVHGREGLDRLLKARVHGGSSSSLARRQRRRQDASERIAASQEARPANMYP